MHHLDGDDLNSDMTSHGESWTPVGTNDSQYSNHDIDKTNWLNASDYSTNTQISLFAR